MTELAIIAEELKAIREQLTRLADTQQRQEERRNATRKNKIIETEAPPENMGKMLERVFSNQDRIKRGDLYEIEKQEARKEKRSAINKHLYYKFVLSAGYHLIKSDGEWYFCR